MTDKYNLKVPQKLVEFFQEYVEENPELGYKFVSQYMLHLLQEEARRLLNAQKERQITLKSGTYTKEDLKNLLDSMD